MTEAYPPSWPDGWPRTQTGKRRDGRSLFAVQPWNGKSRRPVSMAEAIKGALEEIRLLGGKYPVISSNVALRLDGTPRANQYIPADPGVVIYFEIDGDPMAMARDEFNRPEENLRSLTLAISGLRLMQRHGGGIMLKRAFEGFKSLPAPGAARPWWEVLGVPRDADKATIQAAWKAAVKRAAGDEAVQLALNVARDEGMKE